MHVSLIVRRLGVLVGVGLLALGAFAQTIKLEPVKPESGEAVSWQSLLCVGGNCRKLDAKGILFATPGATKVVMVSHGSQGLDVRIFEYVDALRQAGFAALVIDHWTPRGISVTHEDYAAAAQKGGTEYNMAADSLTAAEWLRSVRGYQRVGSLGESQGGGAAAMMQQKFAHAAIERSVRHWWGKPDWKLAPVDAVVGMYPYCGIRHAKRDAYVDTPFLFITGEMDDETPSRYCERYTGWMNERGGKARIVVLPGVGHSFDAPYNWRRSYGPHNAKCDILIDDNGTTELNSGDRLPGQDANAMLARCVSRGYSTGNRGNRFVAVPHWIGFFKERL